MDAKKLMEMRRAREISRTIPEQFDPFAGSGAFMFVAYGCSVSEREDINGNIEYIATNLTTDKSAVIDRRRERVGYKAIDTLLRKLENSRVAGAGRYEVDSDKIIPLSKLREVVYAVFRAILPEYGFSVRNEQIALAEELLDAMAGRRVLLAEAAVGIGKTIVYIIIGVLIKRGRINETWDSGYFYRLSCIEWQHMPVLISTSSIALQKAIIDDYLPTVSNILIEQGIIRRPLRFVLRKGKQHHICENNLRFCLSFEKNTETEAMLKKIANNPDSIDLADIEGLKPHIKKKICVPNKCPKDCPYANDCRYRAFRDGVSKQAFDFIITNHNMLLADARLRAEENSQVLPPFKMLVIDEAHKLLPAARSIYSAELTANAVTEITTAIKDMNFRPLDPCKTKDWKKLRDEIKSLAEKLYKRNKRLFSFDEPTAESDAVLMKIAQIAELLKQTLKQYPKMFVSLNERVKNGLQWELARIIKSANELADNDSQIRWFKRDDNGIATALNGLPKNLNERLYNDLWKRGVPTMLTSGTLSVNGDFEALKQSLGLNKHGKITETTHGSPYNYRENCLLYLTENVPYYGKPEYIDALTKEIERLIRASHGHAAVLFTAYRTANIVYAKLKDRLPYETFMLERGSSTAIKQFKKSRNSVLFASGSFFEGVNIEGDKLSLIILVKLPFAAPDKINKYERTLYAGLNEYKQKVLIPDMLLKTKQAFGRLIRTMSDTGVVAILDSRVSRVSRKKRKGKHRRRVLSALPKCRVTASISEVEAFFKAKKTPDYFK